MKIKYELFKIIDRVYLIIFDNQYDLSMFFLRYQEFYESPNKKFRNNQFEIIDFMNWYSKKFGNGSFSYTKDFIGYNIPSKIIDDVNAIGIMDKNIYDYEMIHLHRKLQKEVHDNYYLIGISNLNNTNVFKSMTFNHELAHGMYYTIPAYKAQMERLVKQLPAKVRKASYSWLKSIGYTKEVFVDETHAYMSTGYGEKFSKFGWKRASKPFVKVYNEFKNEAIRHTSKS